MPDAYLCLKKHVIPFTSQFYAQKPTGQKDADGNPMYEHALWCSCCEQAFVLRELKSLDVKLEDAELVHDIQLARQFVA